MTIEEFFKILPSWQAKELANEVLRRGWYPQTVILVYLTNSFPRDIIGGATIATVEQWCKENCWKNWRNYTDYYWLFESEKEALFFKTVWG